MALSIAYSSDHILSLMLARIATAAELRKLKLRVHLASFGTPAERFSTACPFYGAEGVHSRGFCFGNT
jgi:hypothetical protein